MSTFGIKTSPQHTTYEDILAVWQEADQIDLIDHAWLFDHFAPIQGALDGPCLEGWISLSALAQATNRLRIGLMVTGNTYRHPAVLAKIAATTDVISGGRLDFGVGAGWNVYEHESMGLPLYPPGERIRRFGEACEIWKRLFTEPVVTFDGKYYQLKEARSEPKPVQKPYPPFVIGGGGEQLTLRVVARYADVWNHGGNLEDFTRKVGILKGYCDEIGRDPSEITLSWQLRPDMDDLAASIDDIKRFEEAGASHFVLILPTPHTSGMATKVAEEVIAKVRA